MKNKKNEICFLNPASKKEDALFCGSDSMLVGVLNYAKRDEIDIYFLVDKNKFDSIGIEHNLKNSLISSINDSEKEENDKIIATKSEDYKNNKSNFYLIEKLFFGKQFGKIEEFLQGFSQNIQTSKKYNTAHVKLSIEYLDKGIASDFARVFNPQNSKIMSRVTLDETSINRSLSVEKNFLFVEIASKHKPASFTVKVDKFLSLKSNGANKFLILGLGTEANIQIDTDGEIICSSDGFTINNSYKTIISFTNTLNKNLAQQENKDIKQTEVDFFIKKDVRHLDENIFLARLGKLSGELIKNIYNYSVSLLNFIPFLIRTTHEEYFYTTAKSNANENCLLSLHIKTSDLTLPSNTQTSTNNLQKNMKGDQSSIRITQTDIKSNENFDKNSKEGLDGSFKNIKNEDLNSDLIKLENEDIVRENYDSKTIKTGTKNDENRATTIENDRKITKREAKTSVIEAKSVKNNKVSEKNNKTRSDDLAKKELETSIKTIKNLENEVDLKSFLGVKDKNADSFDESKEDNDSKFSFDGCLSDFLVENNSILFCEIDALISVLSLNNYEGLNFTREFLLEIAKNSEKYRDISSNLFNISGVYILKTKNSMQILDKNVASKIVLLIYEYYKKTKDEDFLRECFDFILGVATFYENFFTKNVTGNYESSFGVSGENTCNETGSVLSTSLTSDFVNARTVFLIVKRINKELKTSLKIKPEEALKSLPSLEVSSGGTIKEYLTNLYTPSSANHEIEYLFPFSYGFRQVDTSNDFDLVVSNTAKNVFMSALGNFNSRDLMHILLCLFTCGEVGNGGKILSETIRVFLKNNLTFFNNDIMNFGLGDNKKAQDTSFSFVQNYLFVKLIHNMFFSGCQDKLYINGEFLEEFKRLKISNFTFNSVLLVSENVNIKRRVIKLELKSSEDYSITLVLPRNTKKFKVRGEYEFDASVNFLRLSITKNKKRKIKIILQK